MFGDEASESGSNAVSTNSTASGNADNTSTTATTNSDTKTLPADFPVPVYKDAKITQVDQGTDSITGGPTTSIAYNTINAGFPSALCCHTGQVQRGLHRVKRPGVSTPASLSDVATLLS